MRVRAAGIEVDAERPFEAGGEDLHLARFAVGADAAKDQDLSRLVLRQEDVAVGRHAHQAWVIQASGKLLHLEPSRCLGPHPVGPGKDRWSVVRRWSGIGLRKVGNGDLAANARMFLGVVGKGRLAGEGLRRGGHRGKRDGSQQRARRYAEETEGSGEMGQLHGEILQTLFPV